MPITYLQMTNFALREINEVPMNSQQFLAARGLQQFAKEAVNRSYFDIVTSDFKWPWLHDVETRRASTELLTLVAGTQWYDLNIGAEDNTAVSWDTFYLTDKNPDVVSSVLPTVSRNLKYITYDEWVHDHREEDFEDNPDTYSTPKYVIRHPNQLIGFSSIPDKTYYVQYHGYRSGTRFTLDTDVIVFPEEFLTVLMARARYYLWLFRENHEQARFALEDYKTGLVNMKRILLSNKSEKMRAV